MRSFDKIAFSLAVICYLNPSAYALDGGVVANPATYPGQVMISYDRLSTHLLIPATKRCSGIVLNKKHVLTSTSCVYFLDTTTTPDSYQPANPAILYVHPSQNGYVGDSIRSFPVITPDSQPNITVSSYVLHPRSTDYDPPRTNPDKKSHNLAILKLTQDINVPPSTLYHGKIKFQGLSATAVGWDRERRDTFRYSYRLHRYGTTILQNPPADAAPCSGTLFCTGYSSSAKSLDGSYDNGAPIYRAVNGKNVVIGLAVYATNGIFSPLVERYGYVNSSMYEFIKQHVPNARFWSEDGISPVFQNIISPQLQMLLFDD